MPPTPPRSPANATPPKGSSKSKAYVIASLILLVAGAGFAIARALLSDTASKADSNASSSAPDSNAAAKATAEQRETAEQRSAAEQRREAEQQRELARKEQDAALQLAANDLVLAWQKAQNEGDLDAYRALYATRFEGIKRAHGRETRMQRDAWLADRAQMFAKPFSVDLKELHTSASNGIAFARFTQNWSNANFHDSGKKELLLVKEEDKLKIAKEEMLNSDSGVPVNREELPALPLLRARDKSYLMLSEKVDINWTTLHPRYVDDNLALRSVAQQALPKKIREQLELDYFVYDAGGKRCQVQVEGIEVLIHVVPHFGTLNFWNGIYEGEGLTPLPEAERALGLWQLATSRVASGESPPGMYLGLRLKHLGECENAIWGSAALPSQAKIYSLRAASAEESAPINSALLRQHPFAAELTRHFGASWEQAFDPKKTLVLSSSAGERIVAARISGSADDCGTGGVGSLYLFFREHAQSLVPLDFHWEASFHNYHLRAATDLDGDGKLEFQSEEAFWQQAAPAEQQSAQKNASAGYEIVADYGPLFLDCGC